MQKCLKYAEVRVGNARLLDSPCTDIQRPPRGLSSKRASNAPGLRAFSSWLFHVEASPTSCPSDCIYINILCINVLDDLA
jgi:hypothetical protein